MDSILTGYIFYVMVDMSMENVDAAQQGAGDLNAEWLKPIAAGCCNAVFRFCFFKKISSIAAQSICNDITKSIWGFSNGFGRFAHRFAYRDAPAAKTHSIRLKPCNVHASIHNAREETT